MLTRQIGKWLNAGVLEDGRVTRLEAGTPQGGVISPLLSNVYLHEVLDVWFKRTVRPQIRGRAYLVRFADDFVIICEHEADARRIYAALPGRFARAGLELHPTKTKQIPFGPPTRVGTPESFDFLGFTHFWSRSLRGNWVVKRKTMAARLNRALRAVAAWCRTNRHLPVREQHRHLCAILRGHCGYYGITGNSAALAQFREGLRRTWRKWLRRRSHATARHRDGWWDGLCARYPIPPARAVHSTVRGT